MSYSESLLYAGYQHLNLTQIFMASIFIGASGAIMDLSVDITSAVYEVVRKWYLWPKGHPLSNIFNYKYVAAELLHTVIGSFGLVTVAPFTALSAGIFLTHLGGFPIKK